MAESGTPGDGWKLRCGKCSLHGQTMVNFPCLDAFLSSRREHEGLEARGGHYPVRTGGEEDESMPWVYPQHQRGEAKRCVLSFIPRTFLRAWVGDSVANTRLVFSTLFETRAQFLSPYQSDPELSMCLRLVLNSQQSCLSLPNVPSLSVISTPHTSPLFEA